MGPTRPLDEDDATLTLIAMYIHYPTRIRAKDATTWSRGECEGRLDNLIDKSIQLGVQYLSLLTGRDPLPI